MRLHIPRFFQRRLPTTTDSDTESEISAFGANISNKQNNVFRLALQNPNGTKLSDAQAGPINVMAHLDIDILGLVETNLHWTTEARTTLASLLQLNFGYGQCVVASCENTSDTSYLPGGNALLARGKVAGRIFKRYPDSQGRFTYALMRGKDGTGVLLVNAYRVCQKRGTRTTANTAYMQQVVHQRSEGIANPDPRNQILDDITALIADHRQNGFHPLIMGDFNVSDKDPHFEDFLLANNLHDLIAATNDGTPPRTYTRGKNRLDFILGDTFVLEAVVQSGSLGIHEGILSCETIPDHTLQWVDFDITALFGHDVYKPVAPCDRQFTIRNALRKHKFQDRLIELHKAMHIKEKVQQLANDFKHLESHSLDDPEMVKLILCYQHLDNLITESIIQAANKAGRSDTGYQRSEALILAGQKVTLWKAICSSLRRNKPYTNVIHRLATLFNLPTTRYTDISLRAARGQLRIARLEKRAIEKEDGEHRASWLEEIAREAEKDRPDTDWETIMKEMIAAARQRQTNRKLSAILKPDRSSLDYIKVPNEKWFHCAKTDELFEFDNGLFRAHPRHELDQHYEFISSLKVLPATTKVVDVEVRDCGLFRTTASPSLDPTWSIVSNPRQIESWLARQNKCHHQQVFDDKSPPTCNEFQRVVGDHGVTPTVQTILDGTCDVDSLDLSEDMKTWVKWFKMTPAERTLRPIPPAITPGEFAKAFKLTNEKTSSSPSGLHYTLWKSISEKEYLCSYMCIMMSLPFMYGFSNTRWETAIDVMLEKKTRRLLEADFNTALKIYGRKLMANAEIAGISSNQWGGRPNHSAPDCATRKLLTWEYARYTFTTIASFFGDLASCFDRMTTPISSMIAIKKGAPPSMCQSCSFTVRNMRRYIRTAFGTTPPIYGETEGDTPLTGEIQGKADIMGLWTLASDSVLSVMDTLLPGLVLTSTDGETQSTRTCDAYVDDTDVWAAGEGDSNPLHE
ncbi:hypothetical protein ACHAWF_005244, partial [Thalassiosira exigua]